MPQKQLPIFPAGVTEINRHIAVQKEAGQVWYIYGHLPVFHHAEDDIRSFRMFTSQMIVNGTVKPKEIVKAFGVPSITVKRYVKVFREQGVEGFYDTKPRKSSASVLRGEVLERARVMLEQGQSVPDIAKELEVLANTLHKAIRAGRLPAAQKKRASTVRRPSTPKASGARATA
jgi:transposase